MGEAQAQAGSQGQQVSQHEIGQGRSQLVPSTVAKGAAQDLGKGGVGRAALGITLADQDLVASDLDLSIQLADKAGLADTRLATDKQHPPLAGTGCPPVCPGLC